MKLTEFQKKFLKKFPIKREKRGFNWEDEHRYEARKESEIELAYEAFLSLQKIRKEYDTNVLWLQSYLNKGHSNWSLDFVPFCIDLDNKNI
jgi:hypothetical protein